MKTKLFTDDSPDLCHVLFMALTKWRRRFYDKPRRFAALGWLANQFRAREGSPHLFTERLSEIPSAVLLFTYRMTNEIKLRSQSLAKAIHEAGSFMVQTQKRVASFNLTIPKFELPSFEGLKGKTDQAIIDEVEVNDAADATALAIEAFKKQEENPSK